MSQAQSHEPVEGTGEEQAKVPYHAPELTQLGSIAALTQANPPSPFELDSGEGWATS
jgi:hypothetical protein